MASLPPQQSSSTRRLSHNDSSSPTEQSASPEQRRDNLAQSTTSVDSQTLLLNSPISGSQQKQEQEQEQNHQPSRHAVTISDDEPRRCWICYSDETEDTPTSSEWRSPCPCALTAHESCLLDWVADLEAPKRNGKKPEIQCPQCKKPIVIARPKNYVVQGIKAVDRVAGKLVIPGIATILAGSVWTGAWFHGVATLYVVFGKEDFRILLGREGPQSLSYKGIVGLSAIPFVLVASRANLADGVLPALPVLLFALRAPSGQSPSVSELWPPSAAMAFAMLPFVRGLYNQTFRYFFAEKTARWVKEIQPRAGEDETENNAEEHEGHDHIHHNHDLGFDFNLEVEIIEEHVAAPPPAVNNAPALAAGQAQPPARDADQNNDEAAPPAAQLAAVQAPPPAAPAAAPANRPNGLVVTTGRILDNVVGALCFPLIASAMGELLRLGLPLSWTTVSAVAQKNGWFSRLPAPSARRPGLLQTKWGRTIIGGCLFVVMKDTLVTYSRYRLAQDHKKRKVLDYDRIKGRVVDR